MSDDPASGESRLTRTLAALRSSRLTRRGVLAGGVGAALWWRVGCYPECGCVNLAQWEVEVIAAAGRALLPPAPTQGFIATLGPRVDAYLTTLPSSLRLEIHALLVAVEHGTVAGLHAFRFTRLTPPQALEFLEGLQAAGRYPRLLYRSLRDLVFLAYYQQDAGWPALGYGGPLVSPGLRPDTYAALRAPDGAVPPGHTTS
jgi:hypothetical protein